MMTHTYTQSPLQRQVTPRARENLVRRLRWWAGDEVSVSGASPPAPQIWSLDQGNWAKGLWQQTLSLATILSNTLISNHFKDIPSLVAPSDHLCPVTEPWPRVPLRRRSPAVGGEPSHKQDGSICAPSTQHTPWHTMLILRDMIEDDIEIAIKVSILRNAKIVQLEKPQKQDLKYL